MSQGLVYFGLLQARASVRGRCTVQNQNAKKIKNHKVDAGLIRGSKKIINIGSGQVVFTISLRLSWHGTNRSSSTPSRMGCPPPGWTEAMWELSAFHKNKTRCPQPVPEHRGLDPEFSTLTMRPLRHLRHGPVRCLLIQMHCP